MIDRAPEINHLAIESDVHLVDVPAPVPEPAHVAQSPAADLACEEWAESVPYVDGSLLQGAEQIILIGSLASICTAFGCDHI